MSLRAKKGEGPVYVPLRDARHRIGNHEAWATVHETIVSMTRSTGYPFARC